MAIINDFEYHKPTAIKEALSLLTKFEDKAKILAGGTDLIVHLKEEMVKPEAVIDVKALPGFSEIKFEGNKVFLGAGVTFTEIIESEEMKQKLPILWQASETVASIGVRNRATLVGNICSAVPSLDSAPALQVYDAEVMVKSEKGERTISIHDWFTGPKKTCLKPDELVLGINIPITPHYGVYEKLGRYKGEDLAQAGIGILVNKAKNYKFAFCAVGPIPKRFDKLEKFMKGKDITEGLLNEAAELIPEEISPISDIRSSKEYRIHMMKVMFKRGMLKSMAALEAIATSETGGA